MEYIWKPIKEVTEEEWENHISPLALSRLIDSDKGTEIQVSVEPIEKRNDKDVWRM
jgi:hypothetical protein